MRTTTMRTTTAPYARWGHLVLALLLTLTAMASTSTSSRAGTASPERLDAVVWEADCSVSYRLIPRNADAIGFVRVRYWAYDAVRERGFELDAPGKTHRLDSDAPIEGTLQWSDAGPTTRLYVYVSSFDLQARSIGSSSMSGICQPKT